jgi:D-glycero-D-manno-heptose 1,7-bisphosphate phosphatase
MLHKAVFLDRDGTIARDVHYCRDPRDFKLLPRVPAAIRLLNQQGYQVIVITNQSGIARGYFTEHTLSMIHQKMKTELRKHNASIDAIYICPHHPDEQCECRKPKPTLLLRAASDIGIALEQSYMIGDDVKDVQAGRAAGCRTVWLTTDPNQRDAEPQRTGDHIAADLFDAVQWLLNNADRRVCARNTIDNGRQAQ